MNTLFAPWRMQFIEDVHKTKSECILCGIGKAKVGELLVVHQGDLAYVVMNKYPYAHGHLMVVPFRHEHDWTNLKKEELAEIAELTQKALKTLKSAFHPEGFNLGVNLGKPAGAGIETHVHQHIVPRWVGDFNFMPLFSETKVISEHLDQTFQRIQEAWRSV